MKRVFTLLFCAAALFGAISCDDSSVDDDVVVDTTNPDTDTDADTDADADTDTDAEFTSYIYALNCGSWGYNNATLTSYNVETEAVVSDLFADVNGYGLGDLAQDILVFGDKIFIAVYNSNVIFVTDFEGSVITKIVNEAPYSSPRYFATDDEYVYVSYFDGGVAKIDPETYEMITAECKLYPEQLVEVDGKLYVTISDYTGDGSGCTVEVYDAATMTYEKSIDVILNPTLIQADDAGNLYVVSMGNYYTIYSTLQQINIESGESEILRLSGYEETRTPIMTMSDDNILYIVEGEGDSWMVLDAAIYAYDTTTGESSKFITDGTELSDLFSLSTSESGDLYVGTSDYSTTGDLYVFGADGALKSSFEVGYNVMKAVSISIEE